MHFPLEGPLCACALQLTSCPSFLPTLAPSRSAEARRAESRISAARSARRRAQRKLPPLRAAAAERASELQAVQQQLQQGAARLRRVQVDRDELAGRVAALEGRVAEEGRRLGMAERLVPKLEERWAVLGQGCRAPVELAC